MMRSLNGVQVKLSNGLGLYKTPLMELLLFLRENSIAKSVDKILRMVLMLISRRWALLLSARWASVDKILLSDRLVSAR